MSNRNYQKNNLNAPDGPEMAKKYILLDYMEFINLETELESYKNDLISLYNQKMGSTRHALIVDIEHSSEGIYNVVVKGPEEVKFIENGRGPGKFPPVNKIQDWVKEKLHETELPRVKSLAFLIGRKISIYGTKGNHLIEECVNELNLNYNKRLQDALDKDMNIYQNNIEQSIINMLMEIF